MIDTNEMGFNNEVTFEVYMRQKLQNCLHFIIAQKQAEVQQQQSDAVIAAKLYSYQWCNGEDSTSRRKYCRCLRTRLTYNSSKWDQLQVHQPLLRLKMVHVATEHYV